MEPTAQHAQRAYDDAAFRKTLKAFLEHGMIDCSRSEGKQAQRFDLQYDQEKKCGERVEYIDRVVAGVRDKKMLEVGAGSGGLSTALALLGADACGVEPDPLGFAVCEMRAQRYDGLKLLKLGFKQCPAEKLVYEDNEFDVVFMISVLEHVRDTRQALAEMYRVLKPGGVCFIDIPNRLWPIEPHYRMFLVPFLPKWIYKMYLSMRGKSPDELDHLNFFTAGKLAREMRRVGLRNPVNHAVVEMQDKLHNPQSIHHPLVRKINAVPVVREICIGALYTLIFLGIYPTIRMTSIK